MIGRAASGAVGVFYRRWKWGILCDSVRRRCLAGGAVGTSARRGASRHYPSEAVQLTERVAPQLKLPNGNWF